MGTSIAILFINTGFCQDTYVLTGVKTSYSRCLNAGQSVLTTPPSSCGCNAVVSCVLPGYVGLAMHKGEALDYAPCGPIE